jgi:hypothetical protein
MERQLDTVVDTTGYCITSPSGIRFIMCIGWAFADICSLHETNTLGAGSSGLKKKWTMWTQWAGWTLLC